MVKYFQNIFVIIPNKIHLKRRFFSKLNILTLSYFLIKADIEYEFKPFNMVVTIRWFLLLSKMFLTNLAQRTKSFLKLRKRHLTCAFSKSQQFDVLECRTRRTEEWKRIKFKAFNINLNAQHTNGITHFDLAVQLRIVRLFNSLEYWRQSNPGVKWYVDRKTSLHNRISNSFSLGFV